MTKFYRIKKFSEMTAMTIRSLQYYDAMGLLKPTHKTKNGHRLYSDIDFLQLHQVTALKMLGLSLKSIQALLSSTRVSLDRALDLQNDVLQIQIKQLQQAQQLTLHAKEALHHAGTVDGTQIAKIIYALQTNEHQPYEDLKKYYHPDDQNTESA